MVLEFRQYMHPRSGPSPCSPGALPPCQSPRKATPATAVMTGSSRIVQARARAPPKTRSSFSSSHSAPAPNGHIPAACVRMCLKMTLQNVPTMSTKYRGGEVELAVLNAHSPHASDLARSVLHIIANCANFASPFSVSPWQLSSRLSKSVVPQGMRGCRGGQAAREGAHPLLSTG